MDYFKDQESEDLKNDGFDKKSRIEKPEIKSEKKKKQKYIIHNITPLYVTLEENGNGFRVKNIWKDIKIGDEILI